MHLHPPPLIPTSLCFPFPPMMRSLSTRENDRNDRVVISCWTKVQQYLSCIFRIRTSSESLGGWRASNPFFFQSEDAREQLLASPLPLARLGLTQHWTGKFARFRNVFCLFRRVFMILFLNFHEHLRKQNEVLV